MLPSSLSPSGVWLAERMGGSLPEVVLERKIRSPAQHVGRSRKNGTDPLLFHRSSATEGVSACAQHFSRIRLAPTIPLNKEAMRDLLELKNIALFYELWTFFRIVHELAVLEGPPVRSRRPTSDHFQTDFAADRTFEWASGVRLVYNQHFSRSHARRRRSYSVPLRPDSRFRSPTGQTPASTSSTRSSVFMGSPMWDLPRPTRTGTTRRSERERERERAGSFKRGDIYKMHAYRNAIPDARSVILYPGAEFRFFGIPGSSVILATRLSLHPRGCPKSAGVGAIPLGLVVGDTTGRGRRGEDANDESLRQTLRRMLGAGG